MKRSSLRPFAGAVVSLGTCLLIGAVAFADSWPQKQLDAAKTGRAGFVIPNSRLNNTLFDVIRWQKPSARIASWKVGRQRASCC